MTWIGSFTSLPSSTARLHQLQLAAVVFAPQILVDFELGQFVVDGHPVRVKLGVLALSNSSVFSIDFFDQGREFFRVFAFGRGGGGLQSSFSA